MSRTGTDIGLNPSRFRSIFDMLKAIGWVENSDKNAMMKGELSISYDEFIRARGGAYTTTEFVAKMLEKHWISQASIDSFDHSATINLNYAVQAQAADKDCPIKFDYEAFKESAYGTLFKNNIPIGEKINKLNNVVQLDSDYKPLPFWPPKWETDEYHSSHTVSFDKFTDEYQCKPFVSSTPLKSLNEFPVGLLKELDLLLDTYEFKNNRLPDYILMDRSRFKQYRRAIINPSYKNNFLWDNKTMYAGVQIIPFDCGDADFLELIDTFKEKKIN